MSERYDAVIIGGGVSGLATGALLAHAGQHVAVLEKGNQLGGRAYTYVDRGFVLNYGAHAMYRPHTGLLAELLKRLDRPPIEAPYPNPMKSFFQLDGRWGAIGSKPHQILATPLFSMRSRLRLLPLLLSFRYADPAKLGDLTFGAWLEQRTSDPSLRRFALALATLNSYTRPASELSARFILRHFQRNLFVPDYVGYISGGWSTMYDTFASVLQERGAKIVTGATVRRLVTESDRVVAALVGDQRYEAGVFVLTAPPQDAPHLAESSSRLRGELDGYRNLQDARALCIDLGFTTRQRSDVTLIFDAQYGLFFILDSEITPEVAPEGAQLLHAMAYLSPEEAADAWLNERRHRELESGLDRYFPGWREATVVQRTLPTALVTSARQTPDQQGEARVPVRATSATNLYFANDARDLPYNLTETCLASAMQVAALIESERAAQQSTPDLQSVDRKVTELLRQSQSP